MIVELIDQGPHDRGGFGAKGAAFTVVMQDLQAEAGVDLLDLQIFAYFIANQKQIFAIGALRSRDHRNAFWGNHPCG